MRKRGIATEVCGITLAVLMIASMLGTLTNTANAVGEFNLGDTVEVYNTGSSGLLVRDAPCGNRIGGKFDGARGVILDGPVFCDGYNRWYIRWSDGLTGWSAEDWLRNVTPASNPDLTVISVSAPSSAEVGQSISVRFTVKNQGGSSSGSFSNRVSLATSAWGTNYSLGNFTMNSLSAGASKSMTITTDPIPSSIPCPRDYYVTVFTDGFQAISESNENNNIGSTYPTRISVTKPTPRYTLTTHVNGQGSISPSSGSYDEDSRLTLRANPASGYTFVRWGGDASGSSTSVTITMNSNKSVTANFEKEIDHYTLTTHVNGQGRISPDGGSYDEGTRLTLSANPASGYTFHRWEGDASGTNSSITIAMNSNKSVTACFEEIPPQPEHYTLTTQVRGNGSVDPSRGTYDEGTRLTLTASPASGYTFVRWGGDASGSSTSVTITMNSNKSVTAYFVRCWEKATNLSEYYSAWGKSLPSLSERGKIYEALGLGSASSYTGTAYQNTKLLNTLKQRQICPSTGREAGYEEKRTLSTSVSPSLSGSVSPSSGSYDEGTRLPLSANPASGYTFVRWGGDASGSSTSVTITMNSNKSVTAYFEEIPPQPEDSSPLVNRLSVSPDSLDLGDSFTISYSVSDDNGLVQVELWRADDSNGQPAEFSEIKRISVSGKSHSGSLSDIPSAAGSYWYGLHVVDTAGNWNCERNSETGFSPGVYGPIKVSVIAPQAKDNPRIDGITPRSGAPCIQVTITGENLLRYRVLYSPRVMFGGNEAMVIGRMTNSKIVAEVPSGSGKVDVRIEARVSADASNSVPFVYKEPEIEQPLDPPSGVPGTKVTIKGKHFGVRESLDGTKTVRFGTSMAQVISWTDEEIVVKAPSDYGIGIGDAEVVAALLSFAVTKNASELLSDFSPNLVKLKLYEWEPWWESWTKIFTALAFPGVTVRPAGDEIDCAVTVETPAGRDSVLFTYIVPLSIERYRADPATWSSGRRYSVSLSELPGGAVGSPYAVTFLAIGGRPPYTWSAVGKLPSGLDLDPATGKLSGTLPTDPGKYDLTIAVHDASTPAYTAQRSFWMIVGRPEVWRVVPAASSQGSWLSVTIIGTGFTSPITSSFGEGVTVIPRLDSPTKITAYITIADDAALGPRDVSVTTSGVKVTLTNGFTVTPPLYIRAPSSSADEVHDLVDDHFHDKPSEATGGTVPSVQDIFMELDTYFRK